MPRKHLGGGRPWQWVFESLRLAAEPASLVPTLLLFSPSILHCCQELPPKEVAGDVAFLVQAVSNKHLPVDCAEAARFCRLACTFVRSVFQHQQLEFNTDSLHTLLHFFQRTITSASTVVVLREDGVTEAGKAKVEAVAALGKFLLQLHYGGLLSMDDVSRHVLFLTDLITYPVTPSVPIRRSTSSRISDPPGAQHGHNNIYEMEVQRLTFVAIGSLVDQARHLVSDETWNMTIQALRVILETVASKKTLVEDYAASRYYVDLLRCVYIVVSKPDWCLKEHVGAFVKVLRMCFRYGLSVSEGKASCSRIWEADLKDLMSTWCSDFDELEESAVHADTCGENIMFVSDKSEFISSKFSFDTFNENDAIDLPNDKGAFLCKSTELRLYSLSTIQAMARGDPEGVRKRSALLLLADNMNMQARSEQATLLTVLLSDPMPKVREASATTLAAMLECRQVLEQREISRKGKGLSGSQRQMFVEVQTGLLHVILHEKHSGTLLAAIKALSLYIATAPFSQLPAQVLSGIVLSVSKMLRDSTSSINQSSVKIAAISCLKAALSISPPSTQLEAMISSETYTGSSSSSQPRSLLFDLICHAKQAAPPNVQVEAIMALKAAAHNYPGVAVTYWDEIFEVVAQVINSGLESRSGTMVDAAHFNVPSTFASSVSSPDLVQTPRNADDKQLAHTAIEVQGAAFLFFAGLSPAEFCSLPAAKQDFILSAIMRASQSEETPAIRPAACEADGVLERFGSLSKRYKRSSNYC
ncbi:hypothetical protein KC19_7G038000 [Ceratodon purpureus]|uniref:DUF4042 domain-containing protein n=1 Tax=Ceratodon purpureus TaxID=3225 RepID=A0A8T0HAE1_CERPU|nr:hypothetical protein KC19_7G038000 [Ceratodon purpureus]